MSNYQNMSNPFVQDVPVNAPAPKKPKKSKTWMHFVFYPLAIFLGIGMGTAGGSTEATSSAPQPTATVSVTAPPAPAVTVTAPPAPAKTVTAPAPKPVEPVVEAVMSDDGTYEVGVDVQPGKYKTSGSGTCYWARLNSLDGDFDAIITNHLGGGRQTVTIKKSDKGFETNGCGDWEKVGG